MTRDDDPMGGEIETLVPLVIRGVPKKRTLAERGGELMGGSGREVRVASTPKNSKVVVRRGVPNRAEKGVG